jgi:hypothetical protein
MNGTRARALLCVALMTGLSRTAFAGDPKQEAREAFERGNDAHERHDYRAAAHAFARADELVPNDAALSAALDEATLGDDAVFAMRLVQRAENRPGAAASAEKARAKFGSKVGYVKLECDCTVDGEAAGRTRIVVVAPGTHAIAGAAPRAWTATREVAAGAMVDVTAPAAPAPPTVHAAPAPAVREQPVPAPRARPRTAAGVSPVWVIAGAVVTAGLGAGTLASFFDAKSQHDAFVDAQCPVVYASACTSMASNGRAADLRTGVLLGVTIAAAAGTAVLAIVGVRWTTPSTTVAIGPGAVRIVW